MTIHYLWIILIYVLWALLVWWKSDDERFDLLDPLSKKKHKFFLRFFSWLLFLPSIFVLGYYIVSFIRSSYGLVFMGVILFGYALYGMKKNNLIGKIAETLTTTKDRADLAAEKSIFPAIAGAGCLLIITLGVLFFISDYREANSDDSSRIKTIQSLQSLGKISTLQFEVKKAIEPEKLFGEEMLYTMRGTIETGVDLSSISSEDVVIDNGRIELTIPRPEIISIDIPLESGRIDYKPASHKRQITAQDRQNANRLFEEKLHDPVFVDDILKQSEQPTLMLFRGLLAELGFEDIEVSFQK